MFKIRMLFKLEIHTVNGLVVLIGRREEAIAISKPSSVGKSERIGKQLPIRATFCRQV